MTLLEYAYSWYDVYQTTKPYMEFKTFVESLKRSSNKPLIESISNGVTVIIEANLGMNLGSVKDDSTEFGKLVQSGDKRAVLGYALPILYKLVQIMGGKDTGKTEDLLTHAVDYITDNWKKLLTYDGSTKPSTFLSNFVIWPSKQTRQRTAGRDVEVINSPHEEAYATYEADFDGLKTSVYGIVKDPSVGGGKVQVLWKAGPKAGKLANENINDLVFYDLLEDKEKTISAATPLDVNKSVGGQEETLFDTAAFADSSYDREIFGSEVANDIDDAIDIVIEVYQEKGFPQVDELKSLIHDGMFALLDTQIRAEIAKKVNNLENNWKQGKPEEEKQQRKQAAEGELAKANEELAKLDEIRKNAPNKSTFGEKYGIKPNVAKAAWKDFVDVLKSQPTILEWIKGRREPATAEA